MKFNFKSLLPHGIAILVFVVFASIYFSPLFKGYNLNQSDVKQFQGMSKEIVDYRVSTESDPLWTNAMFGGMPAYQVSVLHENNFIIKIDRLLKMGLPRPVGILFIAMLGFYILLLCLRVNPWLGIAGAVAFGFSTINILYIGAGHMTKVNAIAYMAPALGGMLLAFRGRWLLGSTIFALFLSLQISANHLQMTYYLMFIMAFVAVGELTRIIIAKEGKSLLKICGGLLLGALLAVAPSMSNMLITKEYSEFSTRGKTKLTIEPEGKKKALAKKSGLDTDYILQYNYGEGELLSTIIPNARGEKGGRLIDDEEIIEYVEKRDSDNETQFQSDQTFLGQNRYWGGQMASGGAFYFGVVIFALFVLAIIYVKDVLKWSLLALAILVMCLASNDPGGVNDFFIHKFPLYNKFRDSKMILVLLQIALPMLAILFVDQLFKSKITIKNKKKFFISSGFILFLFAVLYVSPGISGDFITSDEKKSFSEALKAQKDQQSKEYFTSLKAEIISVRQFIFKKDAGRAFLFSLIVLSFLYYFIRKRPSIWVLSAGLLLLVGIDNVGVSLRYLNSDEDDSGRETEYIQFLSDNGYLDEIEDLTPLKKYENQIISKLPLQLAANSDMIILNQEKTAILNFTNKVNVFKEKMSSYYYYEDIKSEKTKQMIADFAVLNLNSDFRVLKIGNPFAETQTSYFHKSIGGYHGAKLKRYQELIDFYIAKEYSLVAQNAPNYGDGIFQFTPILNMLNTRYVILEPNEPPLNNRYAFGNVWFVKEIKMVMSADQEMMALGDSTVDLRSTAIVNQSFKGVKSPQSFDPSAKIELIKYGLNKLEYESNTSVDCPAVFSEIYYPEGWNCYIDGKQVDVFRANYLLRGVIVPKGKHKIVWKFEPQSMKTGSLISGIGSSLLILSCLVVFFFEIKTKLKEANE